MKRRRRRGLIEKQVVDGVIHYRGRVHLRGGGLRRIDIPEEKRRSETASRNFVDWAQEQENENGSFSDELIEEIVDSDVSVAKASARALIRGATKGRPPTGSVRFNGAKGIWEARVTNGHRITIPLRDAQSKWHAQILGQLYSKALRAGVRLEDLTPDDHNPALWPDAIWPLPNARGVYFVSAGSMIKIGWSGNIGRRINDASAWCPVEVHLLAFTDGGREREREYHTRYERFRVSKEWFVSAPDLMLGILEIRKRQ